jgi:hypothetical protein
MNQFYAIWADAINYERIKNGGEHHWKEFTFCYMSILLSLNIATFFSAIQFFTGYNINTFTISINNYLTFFSNRSISSMLWAVINLYIPSMCVNYFFIFHKRKYEIILSKFKFKNGRLIFTYFCLSVVVLFGVSLLNKLGNMPEMLF